MILLGMLLVWVHVCSRCTACDDGCELEAPQASFIQTQFMVGGYASPAKWGEASSITKVAPVAFLHVPKCGGTQFGLSLLLFDDLCFNITANDKEGLLAGNGPDGPFVFDVNGTRNVWVKWVFSPGDWEDKCHIADLRGINAFYADHSGIGSVYNRVKGHGFVILRNPEQRIMSGYGDQWHSWPLEELGRPPHNASEYASMVSGCAVKLLTRDGEGARTSHLPNVCGDPSPATHDETMQAIQRLEEGFIWVGITEEWTLSMCLMHAMFGGTCIAQEWGTANANSTSAYDTSALGEGFRDVADGMLYEAGLGHFNKNLKKYDVSLQTCASCLKQAGVLDPA